MSQTSRTVSRTPTLVAESPLWSLQSIRFQMVLMISASMMVFGLMRGSLSMAIVCMINQTTKGIETEDLDGSPHYTKTYQVFWTVEEQARIHTSFYVGALLAVFAAGTTTKRFGAKNVLSCGLAVNVVGSFLTPLIVIWLHNYIYVMIIRVVMGFGSGFVIPCGSVIIARWFPVSEKSTAMAIFTTGNQLGIAGSMFLTAKICQVRLLGGWPLAFLCYGVLGAIFLAVWLLRASEKPRHSAYITATELDYIVGRRVRKLRAETILAPTPYTKIFFSPCVFSICMCSFAQSFVLVGFITYLPRYNQLAMQMTITHNGIWSSLPFFIQMITKLVFGMGADHIKKRKVSATLVTKVCNGIASFGAAFCILIISMLGSDNSIVVTGLVCLSMGMFSGYVPGYNTSIVSVAPQFTAFVSSYAQIYSQAASTLAPLILGLMTENGTVAEWRWVFYLLVAVLLASGIAFQIMGHGESERWGEVGSSNPSIRLSTSTSIPRPEPRSICIDDLNAKLMAEEAVPYKKRSPKVSYSLREDDYSIPSRLDELENDCIVEEDEEHQLTIT